MAGVLHGCARTTPRIRSELQGSKESTRTLARRYGLNPKTVAKWRLRKTTFDGPMGPRSGGVPYYGLTKRLSWSNSVAELCSLSTTCSETCGTVFQP